MLFVLVIELVVLQFVVYQSFVFMMQSGGDRDVGFEGECCYCFGDIVVCDYVGGDVVGGCEYFYYVVLMQFFVQVGQVCCIVVE